MINKKVLIFTMLFLLVLPLTTAALTTNITQYLKLDETTGTLASNSVNGLQYNGTTINADNSDWVTGKINNGFRLQTTEYVNTSLGRPTENYSISMWVNATGSVGDLLFINSVFRLTGGNLGGVGCTAGHFCYSRLEGTWAAIEDAATYVTDGTKWYHVMFTRNTTHMNLYINGTLKASSATSDTTGTGNIVIGSGKNWTGIGSSAIIDEVGIWNRTLTATEVTELFNTGDGFQYPFSSENINVTLNAPSNNSKQTATFINFTAIIEPQNGVNVTNETLYIWNTNGSIFTTVVNLTANTSDFNVTWSTDSFELGTDYYWNVYACSNATTDPCNFATNNLTFTSSAYSETSNAFTNSVYETSSQPYSMIISSISSVSAVAASFWYNGTEYSASVSSDGGGVYNISRVIDVPLQDSAGNKTFFWELMFTLTGGSSLSQNSTIQTQGVSRTHLSICNSTYPTAFMNITTKNAENPFPILNATFKSAWSWYIDGGGGSVTRNYSYEDVTEKNNSFDFCMNDSSKNYLVSSTFEIDATGFAKNFHFLTDANLSNTSNQLNLYLLNDSLATATEFIVRDEKQAPLENVYISVQFYDIGTDTFYTVGMAKTSSEGKDLLYLNWYDSLYKFILVQDGSTIKTTTPYKIIETPQIFEIVTETTFEFKKFDDFQYTLYYNDTTSNFVLTFVKPSGDVDAGCLRVIKRNQTNDYLICETCETSSSATVYCSIDGQGNGTFIATFYATGSLKVVDSITKLIGVVSSIYDEIGNLDGTVLAIILAGVIMTFFLITPVLGVIGMILGMLAATAIGFQPFDYGIFIGMTLLGGVVIWFLKR